MTPERAAALDLVSSGSDVNGENDMKPNVLIAGCLALLILCTCAVAGAQAAELYAEPDAELGEWSDLEVTPTAAVDPTVVDGAESSSTLMGECTAATAGSLQPLFKAPWKGKAVITQGAHGSRSHYSRDTWDNTYALDIWHQTEGGYFSVLAPYDGIVYHVEPDENSVCGKEVAIRHTFEGREYITVYLHLSEIYVEKGTELKQGQVFAISGKTGKNVDGPHLHFHMYNTSKAPGQYNSHTQPIERLWLKRVGVDDEFRAYNQANGDLDNNVVKDGIFESDNIKDLASEPATITARFPEEFLAKIDAFVDENPNSYYYDGSWGITKDQYKLMIVTLAWSEGAKQEYRGHSYDSSGDCWHQKRSENDFHFSRGLGPFQITLGDMTRKGKMPDLGQYWSNWKTIEKLNVTYALNSTLYYHAHECKNVVNLEDLRCQVETTWFGYQTKKSKGDWETNWKAVTGTDWNAVKESNSTTSYLIGYDTSWSYIMNRLIENEKKNPWISEDEAIKYIGYQRWRIRADEGVVNATGSLVTIDRELPTWNISAFMRTGLKYNYYYTYDETYGMEIWALSNDPAYIFTRTYTSDPGKCHNPDNNGIKLSVSPVTIVFPVTPRTSNVDVALIIDSSGSMSWNDPKNSRLAAARLFIDLVNDADQIAIVNFANSAKVQKALTTVGGNEDILKRAVDKIGASGGTNVGEGLLTGYNELDSTAANPAHKKVAILLTDGEHNTGTHPSNVVPYYKAKGWPVYTIGFTTKADVEILKDISEKTGGEYHTSLESDTLQNIYRSIGDVVKGLGSVSVQKGKISKGETIYGSLPVDSSIMSFNLVLTWPGSDLDLVLYYPDGNKVICNQSSPSGTDDPDISYIVQDTYEIYKVQDPQQGTWKYDVIGVEVTGQEEDYTLALSAATTIKLGAHTDKLDYDMGEGVRITANFTEDGVGIPNAQVTANVTLPDLSQDTQVLSDSGGGMYEGTFYATQSGHYSVLIEAQRGADVIRQREIEFDVSKKVVPPPVANFTADKTRGVAPLSVQFTDISTGGAPTVWEWDFGDGNTATVQNPTYTHTYTVAGTYTVKLTITNAGGSNTSTRADYITVTEPTPAATSSDSSGDDSSVSTGSALAAGGGASFSFAGLPVSTITIESEADISRALIIAERVRSLPGSITLPEPETYQYLAITPYRLEDADFDEATISFHVPVGYLSAMGKETTDVALMRYVDGQWVRLKTTLIKEEGGRAYYEAATPGFSVFAIVLEKDGATVAAPVSTPAPVAAVEEEEEKDGEEPDVVEPEVSLTSTPTPAAALAATPTPKEAPVVYAPIGLVVAGLLAFALRRRE